MLQAKAPTPQSSPPRPRPCHSGHTQHLRTNGIERERERESKEEADGSDVGATAATAAVRRRGGHQGWVWVWVWVFVSDFVSFDLVVQARPRKEGNGSAPPTGDIKCLLRPPPPGAARSGSFPDRRTERDMRIDAMRCDAMRYLHFISFPLLLLSLTPSIPRPSNPPLTTSHHATPHRNINIYLYACM